MTNFTTKITRSGFSLVELSMVILVMSVLISGTVIFVGDASFQASQIDDEERIDIVDQAIKKFFINNGRLPCPASRSDVYDSATFGIETDCSTAGAPSGTTHAASNAVRIGVVPVITLGLTKDYMFDAYNNRLTYAVNRTHAYSAEVFRDTIISSTPIIDIRHLDLSTSIQTSVLNLTNNDNVMYVLVGHGPGGNGAVNYAGVQTSCSLSLDDAENCDLDEIFVDIFKSPDGFDDNIRWNTKQKLIYARNKENNQLGRAQDKAGKLGLFSYTVATTVMGQSGNAGANHIPLNTIKVNNLSDAELDPTNDEIILGPGHYIIRAHSKSCLAERSQLYLQSSVTTQRIYGISTYSDHIGTGHGCASNYAVGYMHLEQQEGVSAWVYLERASTYGLGWAHNTGSTHDFLIIEVWEL